MLAGRELQGAPRNAGPADGHKGQVVEREVGGFGVDGEVDVGVEIVVAVIVDVGVVYVEN